MCVCCRVCSCPGDSAAGSFPPPCPGTLTGSPQNRPTTEQVWEDQCVSCYGAQWPKGMAVTRRPQTRQPAFQAHRASPSICTQDQGRRGRVPRAFPTLVCGGALLQSLLPGMLSTRVSSFQVMLETPACLFQAQLPRRCELQPVPPVVRPQNSCGQTCVRP